MNYPLIRPVKMQDLDILIQFSQEAGAGITSLPRNPSVLEQKVSESIRSFSESNSTFRDATFLFCLEYEGHVAGVAGIVSRVGETEPLFSYHLLYESHSCPYLGIKHETPVLHFTRCRTHPTEIGTLFVANKFRNKKLGKFLSFSRFLFIANFRERFSSKVIAEIRGVNEQGSSPFWDAVGRKFYKIDFQRADLLRTEHHSCIEEFFPKHPIYLELLPFSAQKVFGIPHPETLPAKKLLESQGFKESNYFDLYDAGPHLFAHTDKIPIIQKSKTARIAQIRESLEVPSNPLLISNIKEDWQAIQGPLVFQQNQEVVMDTQAAKALNLHQGDTIHYCALS